MSFDYLSPVQREFPTRSRVSEGSLLWHWGNLYSQAGQDGILREIFSRLGIRRGTFAEFGAWDGCFLSNCRLLFEQGWSGLFIEADPVKFDELRRNYLGQASVCCVHDEVSAANPLDAILARRTGLQAVDFVSIDVDGRDLEIALASNLRRIGAKVVLIEGGFNFDPRLQAPVPMEVAERGIGQPIAVMVRDLQAIGYEAVCFFQDLYLVRADLMGRHFEDVRRDPVSLYCDAYNFGGDNLKQLLGNVRRSIDAERVERAANIEYMRF